ncbi:MAG: NAD-dependent epimerase/dehydratase family protein [Candidatus Bathyarchaeia archaeon]
MSILISGGLGFIGSCLARKLVQENMDIVLFDISSDCKLIEDIKNEVEIVKGDLANKEAVQNAVEKYNVKDIFHLGAVLSAFAETDPLRSFGVNFLGTINILEAARIFNVRKVIYSSSVAAYGSNLPEPVVEDAPLKPLTVYGISKVFSELWGLYYNRRYSIDFRALRLPSVVGPGRGLGGASAYSTLIIQKAALNEPYEIDVDEDATMPIMYYKDAVKALLTLYNAKDPKSKIYNIAGISPTAMDIVQEVKKHLPNAPLMFNPKPEIVSLIDSWPKALDDTKARQELGWHLTYTLDKLVVDFIKEVKSGQ